MKTSSNATASRKGTAKTSTSSTSRRASQRSEPARRLFTPRKQRRLPGYKYDAAAVEKAKALYFRREELLAEARDLAARGQRDAALKLAESLFAAEQLLAHHDEPHEKAFTRAEHLLIDLKSQPQPGQTEAALNWSALDIAKCLTPVQQAAAIKFAGMRGVSVPGFVGDCVLARVADLQNSITLNERAHIMAAAMYRQRAALLDRARALANGTEDDLEFAKELADALRLAEELLVSQGCIVDTERTPCQAVAHSLASL